VPGGAFHGDDALADLALHFAGAIGRLGHALHGGIAGGKQLRLLELRLGIASCLKRAQQVADRLRAAAGERLLYAYPLEPFVPGRGVCDRLSLRVGKPTRLM
jgi:hypothetical protein